MRTPNTECAICGKPLYRRPSDRARSRYSACSKHRGEALLKAGLTESQLASLSLGRKPGTNNRTGYKHSEETKRKTSESHKAWCKANPDKVKARGEKIRGPLNYNWKGGSTRFNTAIRRMAEYRTWADAVIQRDGRCMECGTEVDLESHHVKPLAELIAENGIKNTQQARACKALWDESNGKALCERCHCKEHRRKYTPTGNGRRKKLRVERKSVKGESNPNYKGGLVAISCQQCGIEFKVKQSEVAKRKNCSRRCSSDSQRKNI